MASRKTRDLGERVVHALRVERSSAGEEGVLVAEVAMLRASAAIHRRHARMPAALPTSVRGHLLQPVTIVLHAARGHALADTCPRDAISTFSTKSPVGRAANCAREFEGMKGMNRLFQGAATVESILHGSDGRCCRRRAPQPVRRFEPLSPANCPRDSRQAAVVGTGLFSGDLERQASAWSRSTGASFRHVT